MKITFTIISAILLSATVIQAIRIKTDNALLFSATNNIQKDPVKILENIFTKKETKVQSRVFEGKDPIKKNFESESKIDESNFIEVTKTKSLGQQNKINSEPKIDMKNMEIPVIKRTKEDPNPLNRRFGNENESKKQISLMLDTNRIESIETDLLQKMSDQISLSFGGFEGKDSMKIHSEKVPIIMKK